MHHVLAALSLALVGALAVIALLLAIPATLGGGRQGRREGRRRRRTGRSGRPADHDPSSGLLTRDGLLRTVSDRLPGGPGALVVVHVALLGAVTETLGHVAGERAAPLAGARLASACSGPLVVASTTVPARLDGDTFAVALDVTDPSVACAAAEDLRERLAAPYVVEGLTFEPTATAGVAWAGDVPADRDGETAAALLARADVALAAARAGGPAVRLYDPDMGERADRRLAVVRGFGPGLGQGQLCVHFQPVVSLGEGTVLGVEALARWDHPELGLLLPDEFVPLLERTGQVGALTGFVLDVSLAAVRRWLDRGLRLSVAVNVPVGLLDDDFPGVVAEALADHGVPPELLTLELTESGVSSERSTALPALRRLHALGCRLAVDDFGTGQSSLAHLRRLPVDQVKIDKSFVLGMDVGHGDIAVVRAIVEMGHTLGLTVVAEGVERVAVRAALAEMGCDVVQGYLVSRPLPACGLDRWLDALDARPDDEGPRTLIA